jgi:hypothetical protein
MKQLLQLLLMNCLLACLLVQAAQAAELTEHPGYLNLEKLNFFTGKQPSVEVTLNGPVLNMLLQLPVQFEKDDKELVEFLKVIDQILVRTYPLKPEEVADTLAFISDTSATLEKAKWTRIVRVRQQEDSNVDIHVKLSDDGKNLDGLVVLAIEENEHSKKDPEVVVVNIAGHFNPAYLANISKQLNIEQLDGVQVTGAKTP